MKIIRVQNQESTELSRKVRTKKFLILFFLLILFIGTVVCLYFPYDGYSAQVYDSHQSVENLLASDRDSFVDISRLLLKNTDLFIWLDSIDRDVIFGPSIPEWKKYLAEEEYEQICFFLNKYHPYEIGLTDAGVHFVFLCKDEDVSLYYIEQEGEKLSDFLRYIGQHSSIRSIGENWYSRVNSSDITRQ